MKLILLVILSLFTSRKNEVVLYMIPDDVPDSIRVVLLVSFNRQDLVFVKHGDQFKASVELQVEVFSGKKDLVFGNYWIFPMIASSYRETRKSSWYERTLSFKVKRMDQYTFKCALKDGEGNIIAEFNEKMRAPKYISDPILLDSSSLAEDVKRPAPLYTRSKMGIFYVKSLKDSIGYRLEITAIKPIIVKEGLLNFGDNFIEVVYGDLQSGSYRVLLKTVDEIRESKITIFSLPIDFSSTEFNQTLTILSFLVPQTELDSFKIFQKDKDAFIAYWERFWKRRDPTPETELNEFEQEFWNRVEYADRNFSSHLKRGAVSDRGLCYIALGPPDEIERHPFELYAPSFEIWYYYEKNYKFTFMDTKGVGEYEIVDPPRHIFYQLIKK